MKLILKPFIFLKANVSKRIDKTYLNKKLEKRKGKCKKCGQCCKYCKLLDKNTKLCKVYKNRPILCYKDFPLDKLDQKVWNVNNCGYLF